MRTKEQIEDEIATLQTELAALPKELVLHSAGRYGTITLTPNHDATNYTVVASRAGKVVDVGIFHTHTFRNLEV